MTFLWIAIGFLAVYALVFCVTFFVTQNMKKRPKPALATASLAPQTIKISKKALIVSGVVILALIILAYILTFVLPQGTFPRDPETGAIIGEWALSENQGGLPFWQLILAPIMILNPASEGALVVYMIVVLMVVIGAVFKILDVSGILVYMVDSIAHKFRNKKYVLLFVLIFAFMFLASTVGMFEELIPLVPIVVLLAYACGWDALTGLSMSLLATGVGFAAGVMNPFTVGVANTLGGMPLFAGIYMRLITFVVMYIIVSIPTFLYAKKIDKNPKKSLVYEQDLLRKKEFGFAESVPGQTIAALKPFVYDAQKSKALKVLAILVVGAVGFSLLSVIPALQDALSQVVMPLVIGVYIIGGIVAAIICGIRGKRLFKYLAKGSLTLLPAVALILIVGSVRYIIEAGGIMDTILNLAITQIDGASPFVAVLIIFLVVNIFNALIPSGSAKAFLIMPMIFTIAAAAHVDAQTAVLAFIYGDGFSSLLLPTNPGLLLILGMTSVSYGKWMRYSALTFFLIFVAAIGLLYLATIVWPFTG